MKLVVTLLCVILVAELNIAPATAGKYSRKGYRSRYRGRRPKDSPVCQVFSGGKLCEPYLKGQRVFFNPSIETQGALGKRVDSQYPMLKRHVSEGCKDYLLPILCNYALPPCDLDHSDPKPTKFCQDDCLILKNDLCKVEYERASMYEFVSQLLPNCSSMPAKGHPDYKRCIRVVPENLRPKFTVSMDDITMFENKRVIFKCRLSSKKLNVTINWYKDGRVIDNAHRTYKITSFHWGSRLRIRRVKAGDAGSFQCVVQGPGGTVTAQAWLKVHLLSPPTSTTQSTLSEDSDTWTGPEPIETLSPGLCETYRGQACAEYIGNQSVWVHYLGHQQTVDGELGIALSVIKTNDHMSASCAKYGIPAMCYHIFPTCDAKSLGPKPLLCRDDCFALYDDICLAELHFARMDPRLRDKLPNCSALPTRQDKDHSYCTSLGIPGATHSPPHSPAREIEDHSCYNGTGKTYLGRKNVSRSGRPCLPWPNLDHPGHNFCRNPDGLRESPWCYVGPNHEEYCAVDKCSYKPLAVGSSKQSLKPLRPVGRTIYVISAIMAVLIVAFLSVIVYLKVQHSKSALPQSNHASSGSISKSTQSTLQQQQQQPSFDLKQSVSEIKSCVFNQDHTEVNQGKVKFLEALGEGGFAKVCKGALIKLDSEFSDVEIAIKRLKNDVPPAAVENFKRETSILANLQDINILCLIGVSAGDEPRFMVFEYPSDVDLYRFLVDNASKLSGLIPCDLSEYDLLLDFALQVASGMDFLVEHNFVHRDLAARNCYVTEDNIVKISNLGIGGYKYPGDYSWVHSSALLPVRWMAPEALNSLQFSHRTDVWSYGVLLWELYTFGSQPYAGLNNQEAIEQIRDLQVLSCPDHCPARMYGLMRECWEEDAADRPLFSEICSRLREWAGDSIAESH